MKVSQHTQLQKSGLETSVKRIEKELESAIKGDRVVELLLTIPGCGKISAAMIRAYTDDINRFSTAKKYSSFSGVVPWVQNSNETVHHGRITKRGPKELRTAFVQVVMGMRRYHNVTGDWYLMGNYERLKADKGSGKSIIATARKLAVIVWHMLSKDEPFNVNLMMKKGSLLETDS
jgi:transposase